MRLTVIVIFESLVLLLLTMCGGDEGTGPDDIPLEPTFSSIQANIFTPKCVNAGCHPGNLAPMSLRSGEAYDNLVNVPAPAYDGDRVEPGDADNSILYLKVIGDASVGGTAARMPLNLPPLNNAEINAIRDWINNGAQND